MIASNAITLMDVTIPSTEYDNTILVLLPYFTRKREAEVSFNRFLERLYPQSTERTKLMRNLGLLTRDQEELQGLERSLAIGKSLLLFLKPNGQIKPIKEISRILKKALNGMSEQEENMALYTLFGATGFRSAHYILKHLDKG